MVKNQAIRLNPRLGASSITTSGVTISSGSWHHVAIVRDSSNNITIYVNGVSRATGSDSGAIVLQNLTDPNNSYEGLADEYALWDSDQSANISAIYSSGVPADLKDYSPLHWYRMGDNNGGTGTIITDQGSGGEDGTLTNGPTFSTDVPS